MRLPGFELSLASVRCHPSGKQLEVMLDSVLLDAVAQLHLPIGQSCDGVGLCGFCRVQVLEGFDNLSPMGDEERKVLATMHAEPNERLACLARVNGPVTITTTYWG